MNQRLVPALLASLLLGACAPTATPMGASVPATATEGPRPATTPRRAVTATAARPTEPAPSPTAEPEPSPTEPAPSPTEPAPSPAPAVEVTQAAPPPPPTARATLPASTRAGSTPQAPTEWERGGAAIVLQVAEAGGYRPVPQATELPLWTLYGDGTVIWTEAGPPTPGFTRAVWVGSLSEAQIRALMTYADEVGFWALAPGYGIGVPPNAPGGGTQLSLPPADLPTASLRLALAQRQHLVAVYPAGSEGTPQPFRALRERALATRPANAQPYVPASFRLEARALGSVETVSGATALPAWPFAAVSLAQVAQGPLAAQGELGAQVGAFVGAQGFNVTEGGIAYTLGLFAPPPR